MTNLHPQFVTDKNGNQISVILPIDEFKSIMEELEDAADLYAYQQSKLDNEPSIDVDEAFEIVESMRKKTK